MAPSSVMRAPEVGGRHVDVAPDLRGRPLGERAPLVEDLDAVADVEDEPDVVVDQEHAGLVLVPHAADDLGEARDLGLGEARARRPPTAPTTAGGAGGRPPPAA